MEYRDPALVGQAFPNAAQLMKKLSNEALQVRVVVWVEVFSDVCGCMWICGRTHA